MFVAVSLNLTRILSLPGLPDRALLALSLILAILIVSSVMLIPGQPSAVIGLEVLLVGISIAGPGTVIALKLLGRADPANRRKTIANLLLFEAAVLPYLVGALVMLTGAGAAGLYWVAAAIIFSFAKAVLDAWVLLVEINR